MTLTTKVRRIANAIKWMPLSLRCRYYSSAGGQKRLQKTQSRVISEDICPIFIVGCGHSGTSLLCAVLDAHPQLQAVPHENYAFWRVPENEFAESYFQKRFSSIVSEGLRPIEKTPRHIFVMQHLKQLYPKCKIIFVVRDPRAVALSIKKRIGSLNPGIDRWLSSNKAALPFLNCEHVHTVRFEDFVCDPGKTLKQFCQHVGIDYSIELERHNKNHRDWYGSEGKSASPHSRRRYEQINQPIDSSSADSWKENVTAAELAMVNSRCEKLMSQFGYSV